MKHYCYSCHQTDDFGFPQLAVGALSDADAIYPTICRSCRREIFLIDITTACRIAGVTRKTMHSWINRRLITTVRLANNRQTVVYSSLFLPETEADE
jgi:hypothetical protein